MAIVGATSDADVTLLRCTSLNLKASGGRGGIISIPDTSVGSTLTITSSTFTNTEAKTDGGLFYIGGTGDKALTLTDSTITTTKARTGSGGIAHI